MEIVTGTEDGIYYRETAGADQHQAAAAEPVDRVDCHECKHDIRNTCQHDVEQHFAKVISGIGKNLLCIIENDICAAPLLENSNNDAEKQHPAVGAAEQQAQAA